MATYNGMPHLSEQLDSLSGQSRQPDELVVGDDGSTDATIAELHRFARSAPFPVHVHANPAALGYGENFIRTALRCRGDWIAFCDQDDVWLPNKLACWEKIRQAAPADVRLIVHDATVCDERLTPRHSLYAYPKTELFRRLVLPPEWHCVGFTQIFDAQLLREIPSDSRPSFPWHDHKAPHDVWIALVANSVGSILQSNQALALYRRHAATVTATAEQSVGRQTRAILAPQQAGYRARANYLREAAAMLERCAALSSGGFVKPLTGSAAKLRLQGSFLDKRAMAYSDGDRLKRLSALAGLALKGGYVGGRAWPFGIPRMLKDLLYAVAG